MFEQVIKSVKMVSEKSTVKIANRFIITTSKKIMILLNVGDLLKLKR